jgi:hypothetical protein
MRTDERSGIFGFGSQEEATAMLVHAPNTLSRLVSRSLTMHLSCRDEHHVMKAITGVPGYGNGEEAYPSERRLRRRQGEFCH